MGRWKSDKDGNHFNGKKKIRSSEPSTEVNIEIDNNSDEFSEKLRLENDQRFTDDIYGIGDSLESNIIETGSSLMKSSGIQQPGVGFLMGTLVHAGDNVNTILVNEDWETVFKKEGDVGVKNKLDEIKKSGLTTALHWNDKDFGYYEDNRRPETYAQKVADQLWEGVRREKDEQLSNYNTREQDYARSKQIIKDSFDSSFNLLYDKLGV